MRAIFVLWVPLAVSCTHAGYRVVSNPDGSQVYEAYCYGRHATIGDCMNQAAVACNGPYKILDKESHQGVSGFSDGNVATVSTTENKSMLFDCIEDENPAPASGPGA